MKFLLPTEAEARKAMPDIYLLIEDQPQGPYAEEQVCQSLAEGLIPPELPSWQEGLSSWVPVRQIVQLAALPKLASSDPPFQKPITESPSTVLDPEHETSREIVGSAFTAKSFRAKKDWICLDGLSFDKASPWIKKLFMIGWITALALTGLVGMDKLLHAHHDSEERAKQLDAMDRADTPSAGGARNLVYDDGWTPTGMLNRTAEDVQKYGVGTGEVPDGTVSAAVVDQGSVTGAFIGRIDFTVHLDVGNLGSADIRYHAFFSYDPKKLEWIPVKITDENNQICSDNDSLKFLAAVKDQFPQPYLITLHIK